MNYFWRGHMKNFSRLLGLATLFSSVLFLASCGKKAANTAASEPSGYVCSRCNLKFYTGSEVLAEYCPACKEPDIRPIVAFICEHDGYCTLTPKAKVIACEKCRNMTVNRRAPRETELQAWGATKKSKAEVCKN